MRRLLAEKKSIAIVVDEFGGTAGMVTLEDLVEEIFGDIQDEHDTSGLVVKEVSENVWEISARMEIENLNENYGFNFPESDEYQTLSGYILSSTGTIPDMNTTILLPPYKMVILKKEANRLELVEVTKIENSDIQSADLEESTSNELKTNEIDK